MLVYKSWQGGITTSSHNSQLVAIATTTSMSATQIAVVTATRIADTAIDLITDLYVIAIVVQV